MWCGVVWCGVVRCGVVWCGVVWCGVVWCGVVWCGVVWCGVVWCGEVWCCEMWYGEVWCGEVWCVGEWMDSSGDFCYQQINSWHRQIISSFNTSNEIIYSQTGQQRFYLGHNDDIICLATNQNPKFKNIIATGEIGQRPSIHVWSATTMMTSSVLSGFLQGGVRAVDFSCSGGVVVAVLLW